MDDAFKPGDKVSWDTAQGTTHGEVVEKVTSKTKIKGHVAKPSEDEPQYVVKSDKTGEEAVHKPDALTRC